MSGQKIVIVKKKKVHGHGHHGGSWKVAYADFVTAMMAFFLVMWIMSMDQGVKDLVQGYFQNPVGFKRAFSGGANPLSSGNFVTNLEVKRTVILNKRQRDKQFEEAVEQIQKRLEGESSLGDVGGEVDLEVTEEGLRIELMETSGEGAFFDRASSELKPGLRGILSVVGSVLKNVEGVVVVEGHTDALPFGGRGYSNWELSVDRANAARRELELAGLPAERLTEVRGYADRRLRLPENPLDPHNRRISVLLPYAEVDLDSLEIPGLDTEALLRSAGPGEVGG